MHPHNDADMQGAPHEMHEALAVLQSLSVGVRRTCRGHEGVQGLCQAPCQMRSIDAVLPRPHVPVEKVPTVARALLTQAS